MRWWGWRWALAGSLLLAGAWWGWQRSSSSPPELEPTQLSGSDTTVGIAASDTAASSKIADPQQPASAGLQTMLLPDGAIGARAETVRIGLAHISAEDGRMYQDWLDGGSQGAGPADRSELATVERWLSVPGSRHADGSVAVGPLTLPWADRYDLQARGDDALHYYLASFTAMAQPARISPTIAAGLRIQHRAAPGSEARVLLRRVGEPVDAAQWQDLLAREAPALLAAMNDSALPIVPAQVLAPLPPGALEVILQIDGVEAQRRPVQLTAGAVTAVEFDAIAAEVARTLSVDLELTFLIEGTRAPVRELGVVAQTEAGELTRSSDARGRVLFEGLDRQRRATFNLKFPPAEPGLPSWPEQRAIEVDLDALAPAADASARPSAERTRLSKTIELRPLQWLLVRMGGFPLTPERSVGNPYPIFVLQREQDGAWADFAADYFLNVPEGLAVSIETLGNFRLAAVQKPWSVHYSTAASNRRPSADGRYRVDLATLPGRDVELSVQHQGQPLAQAPIDVRGPIRGLPDSSLETDASGRLLLDAVTVPTLRVEVPGFAVAEVTLRSALTTVEMEREP